MAKQAFNNIITGSIGNLVFYKMDGKGYVRRRSSLTRKQFKTKACFTASRKSAERFSMANIIASEIYNTLPPGERNYAVYCTLKTTAIRLLKEGKNRDTVKYSLHEIISTKQSS